MTGRRGFALLTVLWLVTVLTLLAATGLAAIRSSVGTSQNRLVLQRAAWAREACIAILMARYQPAVPLAGLDSVHLGRNTWCQASVREPAARLNVNLVTRAQLLRLLRNSALVDALDDWRDPDTLTRDGLPERLAYGGAGRNAPLADVQELRQVRGFEVISPEALDRWFTVQGNGAVNLNTAAPEVLSSLGLLDPADIEMILAARRAGRTFHSLDHLLAAADGERRDALAARYGDLSAGLSLMTSEVEALVEGRVGQTPLKACALVTFVPLPTRLAMVRREVW